jgi:hypothetical protein
VSVDDGGAGAGRSAGSDTFRGVLVIAAAVVVGILLLSRGLADDDQTAIADEEPAAESDGGEAEGEAVAPPDGEATTPSTEPPATTPAEPPAARQPGEVSVLVLNGSGRSGEAGRGAQFFTDAGYVAADPQNAPSPGPSVIWFAEGYAAEAEAAAAALGVDAAAVVRPIDPAAPPIADLQGANLVVVAGTDGTIAF